MKSMKIKKNIKIKQDDEVLRIVTPPLKIVLNQVIDDYKASAGGKYVDGIYGDLWISLVP